MVDRMYFFLIALLLSFVVIEGTPAFIFAMVFIGLFVILGFSPRIWNDRVALKLASVNRFAFSIFRPRSHRAHPTPYTPANIDNTR